MSDGEVVSSGVAHFDSFTSRGEIGSKIRKTRMWNRRPPRMLCKFCRVDCCNKIDLNRHIAKNHKVAEVA